jgi:hypothetical protein
VSLEDQFYPEDGSPLTKLDNILIKSIAQVGKAYQQMTGRSYKDLVKSCYKISTWGFGLTVLGGSPVGFLYGALSYENYSHPDCSSPLEEGIQQEAGGQPKWVPKLLRLTQLSVYMPFLFLGGNYLLGMDSTKQDFFSYSGAAIFYTTGLSFIPYNIAEYTSKADMPDPPEKTVWKRTGEKLKDLLSPAPTPAPIPIDSFSFRF